MDWFAQKYNSLHGTANIWVAFSGGIDSRVLLELAYQYTKNLPQSNYQLQAIHINHGLHKDADAWAKHCLDVCNTLNIPLYVMPIKLRKQPGKSLEELARQARRDIWHSLLPAQATLLLAHHAQDQAETILYRLFRGTGPTGLSGMLEVKSFGKGVLLRPLLQVAKTDIDEFAKNNAITWIVDDSNIDIKFDRNFIRQNIIPVLAKRWPSVVTNITRSGELCLETTALTDITSQHLLTNLAGSVAGTLSINKLLALPEAQCFIIIRTWLESKNYQMPSRNQLYRIKQEIMLARNNATPVLNIIQYSIRRYRDDLYALPIKKIPPKEIIPVTLDTRHDILKGTISIMDGSKSEILLASGKKLTIKKTIGKGFILPGNRQTITICIGCHGKKAKKIFQQHNIPPWQRHEYPLIFYADKLICIVGLWLRSEFVATSNTLGISVLI